MALPKIDQPLFEVKVKSVDKPLRFRPFLVKEEKILMIAMESGDSEGIVKAIKQVINNCCVDPIDVDTMPMFDVQMIFVQLRMNSIGENVNLTYKCGNFVDGKRCDTENEYVVNLNKIGYTEDPAHTKTIMVTDKIGVTMKYPTMQDVLLKDYTITDSTKLIASHVDTIFDDDQVHTRESFTDEDVLDFLSDLKMDQINSLLDFFTTQPTVSIDDVTKCYKCGGENKVHSEDMFDFFT